MRQGSGTCRLLCRLAVPYLGARIEQWLVYARRHTRMVGWFCQAVILPWGLLPAGRSIWGCQLVPDRAVRSCSLALLRGGGAVHGRALKGVSSASSSGGLWGGLV